MSMMSERSYHEARANDELRCAEEASDPSIARVHRELAALHKRKLISIGQKAELKRQIVASEPSLPVVEVG